MLYTAMANLVETSLASGSTNPGAVRRALQDLLMQHAPPNKSAPPSCLSA